MLELCSGLACLFKGNIEHFMRYCSGKNDDHIGTAYLVLKICRTLRENLALASEVFTYFSILTMHAVMSAYYNYAQCFFLFLSKF